MTAHTGQHRFGFIEACDLPPVGPDRFDQRDQRMQLPGAEHEVEVGQLFQEVVAEPLRHAAHRADDQFGMLCLELFHKADLADRLALGLLTDAACVEEQYVGLFFGVDHRVSRFHQHPGERFGVAFVHLAAVGFDKDFHGFTAVSGCRGGSVHRPHSGREWRGSRRSGGRRSSGSRRPRS